MVTSDKPITLLLSGGLDSTVLFAALRNAENDVIPLFIEYGQRHRERELTAARRVAEHFKCIVSGLRIPGPPSALTHGINQEIPSVSYAEIEGVSPVYVPFRNGILLAHAAAYAYSRESEVVMFAAHRSDHARGAYPDCSPEFEHAMDRAVSIGTGGKVHVSAPFRNNTKDEIVSLGASLGAPLSLTWSCYRGGALHCGTCPTCRERKQAFKLASVPDVTQYEKED